MFSSSRNDEVSSWFPKARHGIFTYFFLAGLQGYADSNEDKKITNGEMFDYLSRNIGPYHQIHHLFPKIPHYNLKTAYFVFKNKYPELVNDAKGSGFIFQLKEYFKLSKKWKKNIILKNNKHNFYENFLGIKLSNQFN